MIYHHFGSEDALYRAVTADQGGGLRERWLPYLRGAA
jgi:AcrR family transcriptional regulator